MDLPYRRPIGRPKVYLTEEERQEARKRSIRDSVRRFRRKKKEEKSTSTTPDVIAEDVVRIHAGGEDELALTIPLLCMSYSPSPGISITTSGASHKECHMLTYFQSVVLYDLRGYIASDFWDRALLQAVHQESAVYHAVLALASIHSALIGGPIDDLTIAPQRAIDKGSTQKALTVRSRQFTRYTCGMPTTAPEDEDDNDNSVGKIMYSLTPTWTRFGLHQCNRAIRELLDKVSRSHSQKLTKPGSLTTRETILICCILFICIETVLNNQNMVLMHVKHGIEILQELREPTLSDEAVLDQPDGSMTTTSASQSASIVSNSTLANVFKALYASSGAWLHFPELASLHHDDILDAPDPVDPNNVTVQHMRPFASLEEAKSALDGLTGRFLSQPTADSDPRPNPTGTSILFEGRIRKAALLAWQARLDAFVRWRYSSQVNLPLAPEESLGLWSLQCAVGVPWILSIIGHTDGIMPAKYNDKMELFVRMLQKRNVMEAQFIRSHPQRSLPKFSMDDSCISMLWHVVTNCSDSGVCEQAVRMLQCDLPRRICLWDSAGLAQLFMMWKDTIIARLRDNG